MVEKITAKDLEIDAQTLRLGVRNPVHLVLDNLRSAYNVGSAFRTSDATCVQKIYLTGMCAYPPNAKLAKTALGSTDTVPWQYYPKTIEAIEDIKSKNIPICIVELATESTNFWDFKYPQPVALVFGHELFGVSEEIFPLGDAFIHIPMYGKKATLNVASALAVVLFEVIRQWKHVD